MHWLIVLVIAAFMGWIAGLIFARFGLGPVVCTPVAILGAALGGVFDTLVGPGPSGDPILFYGLSLTFCVLALGGAGFAYMLVGTERRI